MEDDAETGTVGEVVEADGRVGVEDSVCDVMEGSADEEEGVAGVEDVGVKVGEEGDGAGEDSPP